MAQSPNRILETLPQNIFAALQPHLKTIDLSFGDVVAETGEPVQRVYFPHSGVISLVVEMEVGDLVETAMIGRDGVANALSALDGEVSLHKSIVQVEGSASVIHTDTLGSLAKAFDPFQSLLMRHEQVVLAQAQQSAACNASHSIEERLCRWLLRIRDLTQTDEIKLTQEYLAQMLGVRRTSVTVVARTLQEAGLITYRRGNIRINDVKGLRGVACECYEKVRSHYEQMLRR